MNENIILYVSQIVFILRYFNATDVIVIFVYALPLLSVIANNLLVPTHINVYYVIFKLYLTTICIQI